MYSKFKKKEINKIIKEIIRNQQPKTLPKSCWERWHAGDECDEDYHCKDWKEDGQKLAWTFTFALKRSRILDETVFSQHGRNAAAVLIDLGRATTSTLENNKGSHKHKMKPNRFKIV